MYALEPGDMSSRILSWKSLGFLSHVKRRSNDDRFPIALWEVWFCSQLGVPIPELIIYVYMTVEIALVNLFGRETNVSTCI